MNNVKLQNIHNEFNTIYYSIRDGNELKIKKEDGIYPFYYTITEDGEYKSYDGKKLTKLFCKDFKEVKNCAGKDSYHAITSRDLLINNYLVHNIKKIEKSDTRWIVFDIESPIENKKYLDPLKTKEAPYPITNIVLYDNYDDKFIELDIEDFKNEFEMLNKFCDIIKKNQPDLLMAHNIKGFDYPYLYYRINDFATRISPIEKENWINEYLKHPALITILDTMELDYKFTNGTRASYSLSNILEDEGFGDQSDWGDTDFINDPKKRKEKCLRDVQLLTKLIKKNQYIEVFDNIRLFSKCQWKDLPSEKIGWEYRSNNSRPWYQLNHIIAKELGVILPSKPSYTDEELKKFEEDVRYKKDGAYRATFKVGVFKS